MTEPTVCSNSAPPPAHQGRWRRLAPACALLVAVVAVASALFTSTETADAALPVIRVTKVAEYPHDQRAFSQGLTVHNGQLLESTGRYRQSSLRRIDMENGKIKERIRLDDNIFGEGVTLWNNQIIQLTWQNGYLILYEADSLVQKGTVRYQRIDTTLGQGWGITHDGQYLIISDGSSLLRFVDPETWKLVRRMKVRSGTRLVPKLNELEYVNGEILANVWYSSRIARINPQSGQVTGWLELKHLFPRSIRSNREAVLNGIAWDTEQNRLFVTGKLWPSLFEITWDGLSDPNR